MVTRVVPLRIMAEDVRCPTACCMTHVTLYISTQVTGWLRSRATTSAVTLVAVTSSTGIMHPSAACEGCSGMAGVAIQISRKVGGVGFGSLAYRGNTVMTGDTIVHDAGMIKYRAGEAKREPGGMANTAILACWYMAA